MPALILLLLEKKLFQIQILITVLRVLGNDNDLIGASPIWINPSHTMIDDLRRNAVDQQHIPRSETIWRRTLLRSARPSASRSMEPLGVRQHRIQLIKSPLKHDMTSVNMYQSDSTYRGPPAPSPEDPPKPDRGSARVLTLRYDQVQIAQYHCLQKTLL